MLNFRLADEKDLDLFFHWANDRVARENSYNNDPIEYNNHILWFNKRIHSDECYLYVFTNERDEAVGQVRIEKTSADEAVISISVDEKHRGKGYSSEMLQIASKDFFDKYKDCKILAYVFTRNETSRKSFLKAGFSVIKMDEVKGIPSYILCKTNSHAG